MSGAVVRPVDERPSWSLVIGRSVTVTLVTAVALWLLAGILPGFTIDRPRDALLAGFVIGLLNAVVWPALAFVVVPISVLTLGLGAIVLDALAVFLLLDLLPGVELSDFWTSVAVVIGLAAITTLVSWALALDDDSWFDHMAANRARRRRRQATVTDVPGVVFVQLDGLARAVLERALALRRRPDTAPVAARRLPPARRVGDGLVVADRRQPVRHPPRLRRRHAGVPMARQDRRTPSSCPTIRSRRCGSSSSTPTAMDCWPTTDRATGTSSPATPGAPC